MRHARFSFTLYKVFRLAGGYPGSASPASAGLGALVATARRASSHGGSLHAVCSRPQIRKLLWLTGVDRRIPLTATVDGALARLAPPRDTPG